MMTLCTCCSQPTVRNGKSKTGVQRYYCRGCKKYKQESYRYKACSEGVTKKVVTLTCEGCGIRSIARVLRISCTSVIRRIKQFAQSIPRPCIPLGKEYEVDELRTYIGNKQRLYWVAYALRRDTKEVIDFKVGKRNLKTLGRVIDTVLLSEAKMIFTDGYELYKSLVPSDLHRKSHYQINHIERKNLSVRTHLKRLSRKTICFSRSKEMLEACLKIYFWLAVV